MEIIDDYFEYPQSGLIAINKPAGISVQGENANRQTLENIWSARLVKQLFTVHRLDQPVSGIVIFATDNASAAHLSNLFATKKIEKTYLAVVSSTMSPLEGLLTHHLIHNKQKKKSFVDLSASNKGKLAQLQFRTLCTADRYSLLEVKTQSGRFHQIRAQLAAAGFPIKGDVKYGARRANKEKFIHLHAYQLAVPAGNSEGPLVLRAPLPEEDVLWAFFKNRL